MADRSDKDYNQCRCCWGYGYRVTMGKGQTVNAEYAKIHAIKGKHIDCAACADRREAEKAAPQ